MCESNREGRSNIDAVVHAHSIGNSFHHFPIVQCLAMAMDYLKWRTLAKVGDFDAVVDASSFGIRFCFIS